MALVDSLARLRRKRTHMKKRRKSVDSKILVSASAARVWPFV